MAWLVAIARGRSQPIVAIAVLFDSYAGEGRDGVTMAKRSQHLVQILLPLITGKGEDLEKDVFDDLLNELTDRFGGATSFKQSPRQGHWDSGRQIEKDSVALIGVMTGELNEDYFRELKTRLEKELSQNEIMIRALPITQF
jgi:hypothetical protein